MLGDALLRRAPFVHSYPCDWRTKKPVILRASRQWFVDTVGMKDQVIRAAEGVDIRWEKFATLIKSYKFRFSGHFIIANSRPESARSSFLSVLENRPYWCVSRQRVWGAPIPAFYKVSFYDIAWSIRIRLVNTVVLICNICMTSFIKDDDDIAVTSDAIVDRCCDLIDERGSADFWWEMEADEILQGTGLEGQNLR